MNLKDIADKLTTELTGELQYQVTDDVQLYSDTMKLGGDGYVPVLLSLVSSFENENRYISTRIYSLRFRIKDADRDDFYTDIDDFKPTQTTEIIGSHVVTKVVQNPIFSSSITETGIDYLEYNLEFTWTYALSKVGTHATIKIDTVAVPFTLCDVVHDIAYVSNQATDDNYRMTNDTVIMEIPLILSNLTVLDLYTEINSNDYNKTHVLDIDGIEKTVVLKRGQYTYTHTASIVGMTLTFETHYPRIVVEIDGDDVPVTAYQYTGKKVIENAPRTTAISKGYSSSKIRTWSITFVKDASTAWNKLYSDAYDDEVGITYQLTVGSDTFTVEMAESVERFTETGDMALECQFVEYGS